MKIAISTCQTGMVESLSAMHNEHEWHILGIIKPRPDWPFQMAIERSLGRNVYNHFQDEEPIEETNIDDYDLLVDVAESNLYNPAWQEVASKWTIPRVLYITHPTPKTSLVYWVEQWSKNLLTPLARKILQTTHSIFPYYEKLRCPIVYTNETLARTWALPGDIIHFSHDEWGIGCYVGDEAKMLYGKNGYYTWAKPQDSPRKIRVLFSKIERRFGDRFEVHDSSRTPLDEMDWRDYVSHRRLWFEHDFGSSGRALCQGAVKAMCLGLPMIVWKTNISCADLFIRNELNGLVTNSVEDAWEFANRLFRDIDLAREMSYRMVRMYEEKLSWKVARPKWQNVFEKAQKT